MESDGEIRRPEALCQPSADGSVTVDLNSAIRAGRVVLTGWNWWPVGILEDYDIHDIPRSTPHTNPSSPHGRWGEPRPRIGGRRRRAPLSLGLSAFLIRPSSLFFRAPDYQAFLTAIREFRYDNPTSSGHGMALGWRDVLSFQIAAEWRKPSQRRLATLRCLPHVLTGYSRDHTVPNTALEGPYQYRELQGNDGARPVGLYTRHTRSST
jgi:hypothetical protein